MGGYVVKKSTHHIVRRVVVDERTLERVAEALGIPPAERGEFVAGTESIHIYRGIRPTPGAAPSPPGGGRRPRK
jgi:hypothetical protein